MRVLVTGASGFVGRAIVHELTVRGHEIIGATGPRTDVRSKGHATNTIAIDLADAESLKPLVDRAPVNAVIHAAGIAHRFGKTPDEVYRKVNVDGVRNVIEIGSRIGASRFILVSSVLVYGRGGTVRGRPLAETDACHPVDVYARSKLDGESVAAEACRLNGISLSILRPAPIIGEGSKGNFSRLISAIDQKRFIWIGDGSNLKSLVYVGDVAHAATSLLEHSDESFEIFNVAAPPVRMSEVVDEIAFGLNRKVVSWAIPPALVRLPLAFGRLTPLSRAAARISSTVETWLAEDIYSSDRLAEAYAISPRVNVRDAIKREVKHYLTNK